MTWTIEKVNKAAGREDFRFFAWREKSWAAKYGCEARQTGRTEYALCHAVAAALNGEKVLFYAYSGPYAAQLLTRCAQLIHRLLCVPKKDTADTLSIVGAGSITFRGIKEAREERGKFWGLIVQDHYTADGTSSGSCPHRVSQNSKICKLCREKLRGATLKHARLQRAMRREDPKIAAKLGVL
jgi:hypothetical protein